MGEIGAGDGGADVVAEHLIPLRWSDLDQFRHVNNARVFELTAESRARLERSGHLSPDLATQRVDIDFLMPIQLTEAPARVLCRVSPDQLRQDVYASWDGAERVCARQVSRFGLPVPVPRPPDAARRSVLELRVGDFTAVGGIGMSRVVELVQEVRRSVLTRLKSAGWTGQAMVARMELVVDRAVPDGASTEAAVWVSRIGSASFVVGVSLGPLDAPWASASSVLVNVGTETQRPVPLPERERTVLAAVAAG